LIDRASEEALQARAGAHLGNGVPPGAPRST